jgi:UDP-3-O-[3-hydroxymyristoyl] glucosamine N-acyltransferase
MRFDARVRIGEGSLVADDAVIGGGVRIGRGCVIGPGTVIGRGSRIGDRVLIGGDGLPEGGVAGVEIGENCHIFARTQIAGDGRRATRIGDGACINIGCSIGAGSHVGASAMLGTKAVVGRDCEIGDGVWIGPGAALAAGVRVGAGARVRIGAIVADWVPEAGDVSGHTARDHRRHMREQARLRLAGRVRPEGGARRA